MGSRTPAIAICTVVLVAGAAGIGAPSCSSATRTSGAAPTPIAPARFPGVDPPGLAEERPREYPGLHNVVAYHQGYYSGSAPDGEAGFDTLAALGARTIISVDGAVPDVAAARARGVRYIHLPIGYNGFDDDRKLALVRATRDAMRDGAVYIHCHHGKHRSAGAAAAVAASLGWLTPDAALERMKVSGTAPCYTGLWACAASAAVLSASAMDAAPADFPEVHRPAGFVKAMLEIDVASEHLKAIEQAGWSVPRDHPDLVPAAEAGHMADLFRTLAAGERAEHKGADITAALRAAGDRAQQLEDLLTTGHPDSAKLSDQLNLIAASCKECHARHRD